MQKTASTRAALRDQLATLPPFRAAAPTDLAALALHGAVRRMAAGEPVVRFGQRPTQVFLVLTGSLHHLGDDDLPGAISARVGDCAGITTVFTQKTPATRTLVAGPNTTCLVFESDWLAEQRSNGAVVALELASLGDLGRRMHASNLEAKRLLRASQQAADPSDDSDSTGEPSSLLRRLRSLFGGGA